MTTTVTLLRDIYIDGSLQASGATVDLADQVAQQLVHERSATYANGNATAWIQIPSIFRLRLTGTGTCAVDSRDRLGTESSDVASYTVSGATNQIEFPYAGDAAVEIRFRLTGTCQVEVI